MTNHSESLTIQPASADRAIRVGFCVFSLIFSYFAVRLSLSMGGFEAIFADMLGGKPLPYITQFVLQTKPLWISLSVLCAILPFGFAFFVSRTSYALYGISAATAIQVFQAIMLCSALTAPVIGIISGMQSQR